MNQTQSYIGSELDLFAQAINWKRYFRKFVLPYLNGDILEVGAGIAGTTKVLCDGTQNKWVCLEPDAQMANKIHYLIKNGLLPNYCISKLGTISSLNPKELYDCIIYIDVLEHIKDDQQEIMAAGNHLRQEGYIIVLAPAHQWLYSPFDHEIGHFRRYNRKSLPTIDSSLLSLVKIKYLDSVGLLASLTNRLLLKKNMPTNANIRLWDGYMIPMSKIVDPLFGYMFGKTILAIWQKN